MTVALLPSAEPATAPQVEIVVPVLDEHAAVERSIRRLRAYLADEFPFTWRILIADNGSTDGTAAIADRLAHTLPGVAAIHMPARGRGRALRSAWSGSDAVVLCYMDVDLSTDLRALLPLVAPLLSGHSEVAVGTRLARGARVRRGPKREFVSRSYNRLLHATLHTGVSDAQCGFKAVRGDAARRLLPEVRDDNWFFDTELLVIAEREGLRIHEVPVDWIEDRDSRVDVARTAFEDLRGIARLAAGTGLARFMAVGLVSTLAYGVLYVLLRQGLPAQPANLLALGATAVGNTAANRRLTFGVRGTRRLARHHGAGLLLFALSVALTSGSLALLDRLVSHPGRALELAVLVAAGGVATVCRYVALRNWVFRPGEWLM